VSVTDATGPVLLGGGGSACAGNTTGGPVTLTGNTSGVVVAGNTTGGPASGQCSALA
jgi:hypothetical protein